MPIYEYRCQDCGRLTSFLLRGFTITVEPTCRHCQSARVRKLVSRFSLARSEDARLDQLADASFFADVDHDDPRSVARWARKMSSQLGDDAGDDFKEAIEQVESGEDPVGGPEGGLGGEPEL
jgi:putative FmdB family regulatory protein